MRTPHLLAAVTLASLTWVGTLQAQPASPSTSPEIVALQKEIARFGDPAEDVATLIDDIQNNLWKEVLLQAAGNEVAQARAFSRGDLQTGATSGASGSTSAVVSPLLPAIFGAAFENGAITRTVSGSTLTLKVNPAGLICAAREDGVRAVALHDPAACNRAWSRLGLTTSFDTSRGDKKNALDRLTTLDSQFSELTVRYELINHRDVRLSRLASAPEFTEAGFALTRIVSDLTRALEPSLARLRDDLTAITTASAWSTATAEEKRLRVTNAVTAVVTETALSPTAIAAARSQWLRTLEAYGRVERDAAGALVVTLDYTLQRPDLAAEELAGGIVAKGERPPDVHALRLVAAKAPLPNLDVTTNGSVAFFGDTRPGMRGPVRDARVGVEGKWKLRSLRGYGRPTLSFAALYTFLNQSPLGLGVAVNGIGVTERGHIGVLQTKFELPTANNSLRIPISVTYANRTELIKESDVRGQIGISFNLDSLFATP